MKTSSKLTWRWILLFRFAPVELGDAGVMVNNYQDLQADKTLAFYGRTEPRDAVDLYSLLQKTKFDELAEFARQKDTGFDLYWFAVALNRTTKFPDELERWPVKMVVELDPAALKRSFHALAMEILAKNSPSSLKMTNGLDSLLT